MIECKTLCTSSSYGLFDSKLICFHLVSVSWLSKINFGLALFEVRSLLYFLSLPADSADLFSQRFLRAQIRASSITWGRGLDL